MYILKVDEEISLKLLEPTDADELFTLVDESRMYLRRWLPWVDEVQKATDYKPIITMWLKQFQMQDGFQAGIYFKGKLVGVAGFHAIDWENRKTSIGYWLGEESQGYGIMTRVVKKLVDFAFDEYKLNRIEIQCGEDNAQSRAIPERLGFVKEGVVREAEYLYDHFHDLVTYSILFKEWMG